MTDQQIIETNVMIARFMGVEEIKKNRIYFVFDGCPSNPESNPENKWIKPADDLKYHINFNWLMPVVEKINRIDFINHDQHSAFIQIERHSTTAFHNPRHHDNSKWQQIGSVWGGSDMITRIYLAVCDFITWFNQQQNETRKTD